MIDFTSWWEKLSRILNLDDGRLSAALIQDDIEREIITTCGVKTKYGRSLVYPNTILVSVSPEAKQTIRACERRLVEEIVENLPKRAAANAWKVPTHGLIIRLVRDPSLAGRQIRVEGADAELTPEMPGGDRGVDTAASPTQRVRLMRVGGTEQWELRPGRPLTIGSKDLADIMLDPDTFGHYVSRLHASVELVTSATGELKVRVMDLDSSAGTRIRPMGTGARDEKVAPGRGVTVGHGDVIELAGRQFGTRLRVVFGNLESEATAAC